MIIWTAIATGLAAIATAIAAGFTAYMAKQTKKSAEAAEDSVKQAGEELKVLERQSLAMDVQARVAQQLLTKGSMPLLVPLAWDEQDLSTFLNPSVNLPPEALGVSQVTARGSYIVKADNGALLLYVEMMNLGSGVAVVNSPNLKGSFWQLFLVSELASLVDVSFSPSQPVIAPGGTGRYMAYIHDPDGSIWDYLNTNMWEHGIPVTFRYQDFALPITKIYCVSFWLLLSERKVFPHKVTFTGYDLFENQIAIPEEFK